MDYKENQEKARLFLCIPKGHYSHFFIPFEAFDIHRYRVGSIEKVEYLEK